VLAWCAAILSRCDDLHLPNQFGRRTKCVWRKYFSRTNQVARCERSREGHVPLWPRPKLTHDPEFFAKARELNARWLEEINSNPSALPAPGGKYQVTKQIEAPQSKEIPQLPHHLAA